MVDTASQRRTPFFRNTSSKYCKHFRKQGGLLRQNYEFLTGEPATEHVALDAALLASIAGPDANALADSLPLRRFDRSARIELHLFSRNRHSPFLSTFQNYLEI